MKAHIFRTRKSQSSCCGRKTSRTRYRVLIVWDDNTLTLTPPYSSMIKLISAGYDSDWLIPLHETEHAELIKRIYDEKLMRGNETIIFYEGDNNGKTKIGEDRTTRRSKSKSK